MESAKSFADAPRLLDLGEGRRIAAQIRGNGPTVVLEAAGAGYGLDGWGGLDRTIASFATVVTYDRLGVGASEPALRRYPTPTEHANNLAALLDHLPVTQPVIVAGWSMGGLITQQFAALHPQKVAALLLMDPTLLVHDHYSNGPAWQRALIRLYGPAMAWSQERVIRRTWNDPAARARTLDKLLAHFGPRYPRDRYEEHTKKLSLDQSVDQARALGRLMSHLTADVAEVGRTIAGRGLPKVPLIVLRSTYFGRKPNPHRARKLEEQFTAYEQTARQLGGEARRLEGVSHQIPWEAPEDCAAAIRDLIARASRPAS